MHYWWLNKRKTRENRRPAISKNWTHAFAGITLLLALPLHAQQADAPPEGAPEDYVNYYLDQKRDGLKPFLEADLQPHESSFIMDYRLVRKDKDIELLNRIIHPASLACENEMRAPYFEGIREFYLNEYFPDDFELKYFPLNEDKGWELKNRMEFPVSPTHILYIEYRDGQYKEGLQRFLRFEEYPEPKLYELVKCPSEASMEAMRSDAERRLAEEEKGAKSAQ